MNQAVNHKLKDVDLPIVLQKPSILQDFWWQLLCLTQFCIFIS